MSNAVATVAFLQGQAWAKSPDGSLRPLSVGSVLNADEILVTAQGAKVELDTGEGQLLTVQGGQEVAMNRDFNAETATSPDEALLSDASVQEALTVLEQGGDLTTELEETAAGNTGGGGSEGHGFVQLARVIEATDPLAFSFDSANSGGAGTPDTDGEFPRNNPPEVVDQQLVFDEDTVLNGQIIATDVENDTLTYAVLTAPTNGVLTLDPITGAFTFTPNENYNGVDSFVVTVTDDAGNSVNNTISLTITAVNDAPISSAQPVVTNEDTPVIGQVVATDVENDVLSFAVTTNPANGVVTINAVTGAYEYTPNPNFYGLDSFVVTVADGNGGISLSTVSVTINPVNDAPVATNQNLTTAEDTPIDGQIVASDVDNDPLTYTVTTNPMNGSLLFNANGSFTYTPNPNYNGSDSFVVTVSDGFGGLTTSTISIGITPVNDAPVAANRTLNVAEDTQDAALNIAAPSDVDGDTLTITVAGLPSVGTVTLADGTPVTNGQVLTVQELTSLRFDAPANVNSTETGLFQYSVSDGQETVMGTITINVTPANDAPVANNFSITTDEDTAYVGQIVATDIDGDTLGYSISTMPTNGTLTLDQATGQFTYTPNLNYNGGDSFSVLVSDGRGGIVTSVVTVGVTPVNDAPIANPDLASTSINQAVTVDVRANDTDVDNLRTDLVVSNPQVDAAQGTATLDAQGQIVFTPALNFSGVANITYTLTDPSGLTSIGNLTVNVGANTAPTGTDNVITLNEDGSHTFAANNFGFADADVAQTLSAVRIDTLPGAGSLTLGGVAVTAGQIIPVAAIATLVFTPVPDANGNNYASFTFSVQDSVGAFDLVPNTIQLNVTPVNDAPIAQPAAFTVAEDTAIVTGNLIATDIDAGAVLTYAINVAAPAGFTFNSDGSYSFDPSNTAYQSLGVGQQTVLTIPYTVTDDQGATSIANLVITVTGTNDIPVAQAASFSVAEDAAIVTGSVIATDIDANATHTYALNIAAPAGLTFNSDGSYSFDATNAAYQSLGVGQQTVLTIPYTVTDDQGATSVANLEITVTGTNDGPVANADVASTNINTDVVIDVRANDSDIDNLQTDLVVSNPQVDSAQGTVTLDAQGRVVFTPALNFSGLATITYTLTDPSGAQATGNVTVNVGANTTPTGTDNVITLNEDGTHTFAANEFGFADADALQTFNAVRIDSLPAAGSLTLGGVAVTAGQIIPVASIGNLEFTPAADANGVNYANFTFSVQDSAGGFDTVPNTVQFNVVAVNDAPTVSNFIPDQNATEDSAFNFQFAANSFADADVGDTLTYTAQLAGGGALPAWLSFDSATRTFSGTPANGDVGSISIDVIASDGTTTVTDTFDLVVVNVNDAPTLDNAIADQNATEDAAFNFQFAANSFSDVDLGDVITYSAQLVGGGALPSWLSFDPVTRTFSGTPANGDVGTISVQVIATDIAGATASDDFDIVIANTNDAPTVSNFIPDQNATEDSAFNFQFAANSFADADVGDTLTYTAQLAGGGALPAWLSFDSATRTFSGTPANGDVGSISIDVIASDGTTTVTDTFDLVVVNVNDAPTLDNAIADQNATEDAAFNFQFAANSFSDVDLGDVITYSAQLVGGGALPSWLSFDPVTRTFSGTPANGDVGTISVQVIATDIAGATASDDFDIVIANTNDAPTVSNFIPDQNATEDSAFNFQFAANSFADADVGDTLTYTAQLAGGGALPAWLSFDSATRTFSGTPANGDVGSISIDVIASDGTTTVTDTFDLVVVNVNDAPTLDNAIADQNATEDAAFNFQFAANSFSDVDLGDVITYSAQLVGGGALPSWLSFDPVTRTFSGTPANGDVGTISVQVIATDIAGATASDDFDIVIANTNDAPTVSNFIPDQNATEDSAFNFQFAANSFADADVGDTLTYTAQLAGGGALPAWLSFDSATRTFSGTPANGDVGSISIDVIASDGTTTVTDTFDLVVGGVNDAPENSVPSTITMNEDTTQAITGLSVNDVDAGSSAITVTLQITNGILNVSGGLAVIAGNGTSTVTLTGTQAEINSTLAATVNYVPATNFSGTSSLTITTNDNGNSGAGGALTDVDTVTITVNPVDDATQITPVSQNLTETNSILSVNGTINAVDVDSPAGFIAQNNVAGSGGFGLFTLAANGQWSYSTNNAQNQFAAGTTYTDTLTVTALDGTTSTITVNILGTNDAPSITGLVTSLNYAESNTATITRTIIDSAVVLTDVDSANFAGGNVTVTINNVVAAQDQLTVQNQGTGVNQLSVSGTNVSYNFGAGAVLIGTISGGTLGAPLVISLNNNATPVAVDALVQRIAYGNSSQLPNTTPRSITLSVTDGDGTANGGTDTFTQNITINVASNNDAPVLGALGGTRTYTEGGAAVVLDTNATIADGELVALANFGGMTLTVGRRGGINTDDDFVGIGTLSLTGGNVVLNGVTVGSYNAAQLDAGQLLITFANGVTNAQATSVLRQIAYRNTSDAPPSSLIVDFVLNDGNTGAQGSGGARNSTTVGVTVNITGVNDAPVAQALTLNGTEETNLPISLTGSDVDGTVQSVQLVNLPSGAQGVLYLSDGVTAVTTAMNLTPAQASNLIFTPTNNFNGNVSFNFIVRDNLGLASAPAAVNISVAAVNDAPLNAVPAAITMNEDTTQAITGLSVNDVDAGSSSITVTLQITNGILNVSGGLAVIAGNGTSTVTLTGTQAEINSTLAATVNYVPSANFSGTSSLTITTNDNGNSGAGGALIDVDTVTITINPIDDGSVANQNVVTNEDVVLNGNLPTTDADGAVTYAVITNQATTNGTVSVAANGSYTYTPNANYSGSDSFVVNVTDAQGFTTPVTVNVTVNPIDDGSVANQNVVTNEDVVLNGNLPTTDADGAVTYAVITNQATTNGTVSVAANGSYTYTPNANYSGSDSFVVNVTDAQGFTTPVTVNVTVNPIDDGAVANQNVVTNEDVVLNGNLPTTDADGAVTYAVITNQATTNGTVSVAANGSYTYTPNANYSGSDSFVVNVTDAQGFVTPVTVNVTVNPIDDGAVANQNVVTNEDVVLNGNLPTTDADGAVTYAVVTNQATTNGTVSVAANGSYTYTPNANYSGSDSFVVNVTDAQGFTTPVTVNVTVNPIDDGSVANQNVVTNEDVVLNGNLPTTDADGAVTYAVITNQATTNGTVSVAANGSYTYTPNANYSGSDSFVVNVTDAQGFTTPVTVNVTVNPINDAPITTTANLLVNEEAQNVSLGIVAPTDVDSASLTITVSGLPNIGVVTLANGTAITVGQSLTIAELTSLQYDAPMEVLTTTNTSFTYTVSDGVAPAITGVANITVNPVNDAPIANDDPEPSLATTPVGLLSEYFGYQEGVDGGNLSNLAQVTTFINGRTPDATFTATEFRYGLDDLFGNNLGNGTNLQLFLGADAASLSADPGTTTDAVIRMRGYVELDAGTYNFRVRGDDGYQIKIDGVVVAQVNAIQPPTGTVHTTFTVAESGFHQIEVLYWDQGGQAVFQAEISNNSGSTYQFLSQIPTVSTGVFNLQEDNVLTITPSSLLANDSDIDGDVLSVLSVGNATHGTVSINGSGDIIFTPQLNYSGPASFEYTVSDGNGGTDVAKVAIYISPVNDAPTATGESFSTNEDAALTLTPSQLLTNDSDIEGDVLTISSVQGAVNGTVALVGSNVVFTPTANYNGPASFTYTVSDGNGGSSTATVNVTVNSVNDAPSGINQSVSLVEDKAYTFTLSDFSFSDVDNNSLNAVRITAVPGTGTVFLNNVAITSGTTVAVADIVAGRLVYLPSLNSNLSRTMTFQVQDDGGTANGGVNLDQSANVLTLNITADANDINAGGTSTTQTLALNVGNISINDNGGAADLINITSTGAPSFSAFNFERFGNNLEYQATSGANNTHVTVINEYVAGNKIEAISFTGGGDYSSYSLGTAAYSINTTATGIADVQEILAGSSIDDTLTGGGGTSSDMLFGGAGNDTLTTTGSGTHLLVGGSGNDTLTGGTGADVLLGGSGNDSLTGGAGVDVFVWKLADKGIAGSPATDTVADFTESATDKLNISDLLQGENSGNLTNYLHFTYDSGTNATTVHISSSGGYSSGFSNSLTDQTIVLSNYNPGSTSDATIISNLIAANKLITD